VKEAPRRLWTRENVGRVSVIRTWGTRLPKRLLPLRLANLGTYYMLAAMAAFRHAPPEIVIAETDPPLLGALGAMLKRRWNCRFVYNVRDLYPDIARANGGVRSRVLLEVLERGNRMAYRWADKIVVLGNDMSRRVMAKGVPPERIEVVPDWVDCGRIRPLESNPLRREFGDKFVVMYSGNIGLSQQLETMVEAASQLRGDPRILFVMIGEGARKQWLMERAERLGLPNLIFLPYRPKDRLAESLGAADLHLIPLSPGTAGCLVPSKIYGILAAARPFVAIMEEDAEIAQLARENRLGFVSAPGDGTALARTVLEAIAAPAELKQMGLRARRLARQRYDRPVATRRFAEMLEDVARAGANC
jgi:glycosyltransferase involved in cell wall biosynthesis